MEEKTFEWALCRNNPTGIGFLKTNYKHPVTEEEFVNFWGTKVRYASLAVHKAKKYSKSTCRSQYRRLKNRFGFFTPNARAD